MEKWKREYPELVGKEVSWFNEHGEKYTGVVIGCDYDVGLTIKNIEDSNDYLTCLPHPALKPAHNMTYVADVDDMSRSLTIYGRLFQNSVGMIRTGDYNSTKASHLCRLLIHGSTKVRHFGGPEEENCVFGS